MPKLQETLQRDGKYDALSIFEMLCKRQAQFWCSDKSFAVTELLQYPLKKVFHVWLFGGDLEDFLKNFHDQGLAWAKAEGCIEAQFDGRIGWHKVLPERWERRSETCVFDLREG